jgi:hypothetical protein
VHHYFRSFEALRNLRWEKVTATDAMNAHQGSTTMNCHIVYASRHKPIYKRTHKLRKEKGSTNTIIPLTGAPSINSNFARVSVSTYVLEPDPVDSRRRISNSMFFIFILTRRKYIFPIITSLRWYLKKNGR